MATKETNPRIEHRVDEQGDPVDVVVLDVQTRFEVTPTDINPARLEGEIEAASGLRAQVYGSDTGHYVLYPGDADPQAIAAAEAAIAAHKPPDLESLTVAEAQGVQQILTAQVSEGGITRETAVAAVRMATALLLRVERRMAGKPQ